MRGEVHRLVHGVAGVVLFFVGGDVGFLLEGQADFVEAFEQDLLAERLDVEAELEAKAVGDGLVRQIDGEPVADVGFGAAVLRI